MYVTELDTGFEMYFDKALKLQNPKMAKKLKIETNFSHFTNTLAYGGLLGLILEQLLERNILRRLLGLIGTEFLTTSSVLNQFVTLSKNLSNMPGR